MSNIDLITDVCARLEFIQKDLGFDGGFNYKKESANDALKRLAPNGIDIYYENVSRRYGPIRYLS